MSKKNSKQVQHGTLNVPNWVTVFFAATLGLMFGMLLMIGVLWPTATPAATVSDVDEPVVEVSSTVQWQPPTVTESGQTRAEQIHIVATCDGETTTIRGDVVCISDTAVQVGRIMSGAYDR